MADDDFLDDILKYHKKKVEVAEKLEKKKEKAKLINAKISSKLYKIRTLPDQSSEYLKHKYFPVCRHVEESDSNPKDSTENTSDENKKAHRPRGRPRKFDIEVLKRFKFNLENNTKEDSKKETNSEESSIISDPYAKVKQLLENKSQSNEKNDKTVTEQGENKEINKSVNSIKELLTKNKIDTPHVDENEELNLKYVALQKSNENSDINNTEVTEDDTENGIKNKEKQNGHDDQEKKAKKRGRKRRQKKVDNELCNLIIQFIRRL